MGKWISNSVNVLESLGGMPLTKEFNSKLNDSRILGMKWRTCDDTLGYSNYFVEQIDKIPTKREVLRLIMSIFDPLGLIAHILIHAKILLREIWRSQVDWDTPIGESLFKKWIKWHEYLQNLERIGIPRWLSTTKNSKVELHCFSYHELLLGRIAWRDVPGMSTK